MRILVTGGAGFIGSHTVEALARAGHIVVVWDDFSTGRPEYLEGVPGIRVVQGDVRHRPGLLDLVRAERPDAVLHLAALTSDPLSLEQPADFHDVNLTGTLNVLEVARQRGVRRVVLASSSAAYGSVAPVPSREDYPVEPETPYGLTKRGSELYAHLYARVYGMETVPLRYFNVYGPRSDPSSPYAGVITIFLAHLLRGDPVPINGDGSQTRDYIEVSDVARANTLALTQSLPRYGDPVNIGTGVETSVVTYTI